MVFHYIFKANKTPFEVFLHTTLFKVEETIHMFKQVFEIHSAIRHFYITNDKSHIFQNYFRQLSSIILSIERDGHSQFNWWQYPKKITEAKHRRSLQIRFGETYRNSFWKFSGVQTCNFSIYYSFFLTIAICIFIQFLLM